MPRKRSLLLDIFTETIESLEPSALVRDYLLGESLGEPVTVLALGKAAVAMAMGARRAWGNAIEQEVVVAPEISGDAPRWCKMPASWMAGDHPVPGARSEQAGHALLDAAAGSRRKILALISGGGSALAALPCDGLGLGDKAALLQRIYAAGAGIEELNVVRKHLSALKGGQLAAAASVPITTLVISDVVGDCLSTVASGPTCPDSSTFAQALEIVHAYCGDAIGPAVAVLEAGAQGERPETPKARRPQDRCVLLAGIGALVERAVLVGKRAGHDPCHLPILHGDVEEVADSILQCAMGPGLWVGGGEPTIVLPSSPGVGGRAQHLALLLAERIAGDASIEVLVAGSDGIDGNSDAAGAVVDGTTWDRLRATGSNPVAALESRDSASALASVDAQIITGPTGINHADLVLVWRQGSSPGQSTP